MNEFAQKIHGSRILRRVSTCLGLAAVVGLLHGCGSGGSGIGGPVFPTPTPSELTRKLSFTLVTQNGPVEGATGAIVFTKINGELAFISDQSNSDGNVELNLSEEIFNALPEKFVVSAYKSGAIIAKTFAAEKSYWNTYDSVNITANGGDPFEAIIDDENVIAVDITEPPVPWHAGDDHFGGSINSQFQSSAIDTAFFINFEVTAEELGGVAYTLHYLHKGVQTVESTLDNRLYINGAQIAFIPDSPQSGGYGSHALSLPPGALVSGTNQLIVSSGQSLSGDFDDFELTGLYILMAR